jgi:hypothetical protein
VGINRGGDDNATYGVVDRDSRAFFNVRALASMRQQTKYFIFLSPTSARFPTYILDGRSLACFAARV